MASLFPLLHYPTSQELSLQFINTSTRSFISRPIWQRCNGSNPFLLSPPSHLVYQRCFMGFPILSKCRKDCMEWDSSSDSLAKRKLENGPSWVTFLIERGEPMIDPRVPRKSDKQPGRNSYSPNSNPVKTFKQKATERSNS